MGEGIATSWEKSSPEHRFRISVRTSRKASKKERDEEKEDLEFFFEFLNDNLHRQGVERLTDRRLLPHPSLLHLKPSDGKKKVFLLHLDTAMTTDQILAWCVQHGCRFAWPNESRAFLKQRFCDMLKHRGHTVGVLDLGSFTPGPYRYVPLLECSDFATWLGPVLDHGQPWRAGTLVLLIKIED